MGELRTIDADDLDQVIVATEREIAGEAWGNEETDHLDETGDRTLEGMGTGLEGQHEAEGEDDAEGSEESEGDGETDGEGEGEGDGEADAAAAGKEGEGDKSPKPEAGDEVQPQGRVPPGKYREIAERARLAEAERDRLKQQLEATAKGDPEVVALKAQIATLTDLVKGGRQQPAARTEPEPPAAVPDIFENPTGFAEHLQKGFETKLDSVLSTVRQNSVSMSFELAHVRHADAFPKAMEAINKLDPQNPQDRQLVQNIYNSPNPGEALVRWHRQSEALSRVGSDPAAYEERIRNETRDALLKDPEFRKALLADMRGDAVRGDNGSPRTENRLPPSLKRAPGASTQGARHDHQGSDDSEQGVADAAWR